MSISEIHALLALMDDPDETVYDHVRDRLLSKGKDVLPFVNDAALSGRECALFQSRLTKLQEGLQQSDIREELEAWMECGGQDIWAGAQLVQRAVDPAWQVAESNYAFESLKKEVWLELNEELTALEQVRILNHVLYDIEGFTNAKSGQPDPKQALLGEVMAECKGNPLGLGILYLSLAQDLNLPIHGVNLPNHFILCYCDEYHIHHESHQPDNQTPGGVLFYINPFSQGTVINKAEVSEFLSHLELPVDEKNCGPCGSVDIIRRLIGNVAYGYERSGHIRQAEKMRELLMFVETGATETPSPGPSAEGGESAEGGTL